MRIVLILNFISYIILIKAAPEYTVTISSVECQMNAPQLIEYFHCQILEKEGTMKGYGSIQFRRSISKLAMSLTATGGHPILPRFHLFTIRTDVCDFLGKMQSERHLNFMNKLIVKYVNEVPRCPLKAHFNYTIAGAYFGEDNLPPFLLIDNYTARIAFYENVEESGHFQFSGQFLTRPNRLRQRARRGKLQ